MKKNNTAGLANSGLKGITDDLLLKAQSNFFIGSALKKVANMTVKELISFAKGDSSYLSLFEEIIIPSSEEKNRRLSLEEAELVLCCPNVVNEIADRCDNKETKKQKLKMSFVNISQEEIKTLEDLKKELFLIESSPDELVERILFFCTNKMVKHYTILGYWQEWVIAVYPFKRNRIKISVNKKIALVGPFLIVH
jgi:hypothetical protein